MTAYLSPLFGAGTQLMDNNGALLSGGKIYTYQAGSAVLYNTWTDIGQSVLNANPIVLDASGRVPNEIWLASGIAYKFILQDSLSNVIGTWDNIQGVNDLTVGYSALSASSGSSLVGFIQSGVGAVARTLEAKSRENVSALDFGAIGNGIADDTAAILAALATGKTVYLPNGTYKISSTLTLVNQSLIGESSNNTSIVPTSSVAIAIATSGGSGFEISHLYIDGTNTTGKVGVSLGETISSNYVLRDIRIQNFLGTGAHGLVIKFAVSVSIYDAYINGNQQGVYIIGDGTSGNTPTTIWFYGSAFRASIEEGVLQLSGEHVEFTDCVFESNHKEGLKIVPPTGANNHAYYGRLTNCWFESNWLGDASWTNNTGNKANYTYALVVDGSNVNYRAGVQLVNVVFNTSAVLSDTKSIHFNTVNYTSLSNVVCKFSFADSIVVDGASSFVQFNDNSGDASARFTNVVAGNTTTEYPVFGALIGSTHGGVPTVQNDVKMAAAKGVDFAANGALAGMTSKVLADYEEGTWTPTQGSGLTVVGAFTSGGTYIKEGHKVTLEGYVKGATSVAVSAAGLITGNCPYVARNAFYVGAGIAFGVSDSAAFVNGNTTNLYSNLAIAPSTVIYFTVTYFVP